MLERWQDSLERITSVASLPPYDKLSSSGARGDAGTLRRQLFLLRSAELRRDRPDFELVLDNLNWVSIRQSRWPWPDYLMARAFMSMSLDRMPITVSTGQAPHEAFSDAIWRHLNQALHIDTSFAVGRNYLFRLMADGSERPLRPLQYQGLREELARPAPNADALLVWARDLRRHKHFDEALQFFERSIAAGGDPSRLALERARTIRVMGDTSLARAVYWSGVNNITPTGRAEYRQDLAWILERDSLAEFDQVPDDSLAPWLDAFWSARDAEVANAAGDRLQTQLARWSYVFGRFGDIDPWKRTMYTRVDYWFESGLFGPPCVSNTPDFFYQLWRMPPIFADDPRYREPIIDQRGLLYIRHGEPVRRFTNGGMILKSDTALWFQGNDPYRDREVLAAQALHPRFGGSETWLYLVDGRYRALGLRGSQSMGFYAATTLGSYLEYDPRQWLALADYIPIYSASAETIQAHPGGIVTCRNAFQAALKRGRADSRVMINSESDAPPITHPYASSVQVFALGREADHDGKALITLAMGGKALRPDTMAPGIVYPIQFRVVAREQKSGRTVTLDTARVFTAGAELRPGQSLAAFLEVPLGAGIWEVAVRANPGVDSIGLYSLTREVIIPETRGISLSDVIPGIAGAPEWSATDFVAYPVNLFAAWKPGATAELFFEVHGVPNGESYRTTIEVKPTDPKVKQMVSIASTDRASGPVSFVRKSLGLEKLPPGNYQLTVTVEHGPGRATRVRPITIVKP